MTGEIPTEIGKLSSLHLLELSENKLIGPLPIEMNNMEMLETLSIESVTRHSAGISGPLLSFANMPNIREINFGSNSLTGTIPSDFLNSVSDKYKQL